MLQWKTPEFDPDVFDPSKSKEFRAFVYNADQARDMIDYLFNFKRSHPVCVPITELLHQTAIFLAATNVNSPFLEMRKRNTTENDLKEELATITNAFDTALNTLNTFDKQSTDYKLLNSAILFCCECILRDIKELKQHKDEMYEKFWKESSLQKTLSNLGYHLDA